MKVTRSARKTLRTGARWKKGQSSSSNPRCVRFREAASTRRLGGGEPGGGITTTQLRQFDRQLASDSDGDDDDEDGAGSQQTWATNFTGCTNQCFGQVVTNFSARQSCESRRQTLAVLAAVTQLIREQGGSESNEEYVQALLTALASVEAELREAAAYLLSMLLRRTDAAVVAKAFPAVAKVCQQLLGELPSDSGSGLAKSLLLCLGRGLACLRRGDWHSAATRQALQSLLMFCFAERPRVRKAALLAAADACSSCEGTFRAPAAQLVAFACDRVRDKATAVPALRLLAACAPTFAEKQARTVIEALLAVLPMAEARLFTEAIGVVRALLWAWPQCDLPAELAGQTLTALYDVRPALDDAASSAAWLETMRAGVAALASVAAGTDAGAEILGKHLVKLFNTAFATLAECRPEARDCASGVCHHLIADTVGRTVQPAECARGLLPTLQLGLTYQFRAAWPQVTQLLAAFFRCYGTDCYAQLGNCLQQLAELRDSADDTEAAGCLQLALAAALEELGPRRLLAAVPLQLQPEQLQSDDWRRCWVLPLLRRHVRSAELSLFISDIMPLADACGAAADKLAETEVIRTKQMRLLQLQLWDTLPAFCTKPTDLTVAMPLLAKRIGQMLQVRDDLRQLLLNSLRKLLSYAAELGADSEEFKLMQNYAKNYLPRLFSLYCSCSSSSSSHNHLPILETIRAYCVVAPQQLLADWFAKSLKLATEAAEAAESADDTSGRQLKRLESSLAADLLIAIGPHLPESVLANALTVCTEWCCGSTAGAKLLQKKGYRLLQQLLGQQRVKPSQSQAALAALAESVPSVLAAGQECVIPSSRKCRLRCLVLALDADWLAIGERRRLAELALPEAVLATAEQNCKAREAADALICHIFHFFAKQQQQTNNGHDEVAADSADRFLNIIFTSSAGSDQAMQAALNAVSGLLPHLRLVVTQPMLESLLQRLASILKSQQSSRCLVKAAIRCVMVAARRLLHVCSMQQICQCVAALPAQHQLPFRATVRRILEKLYAAFPYEALRAELPDYCQKVLANVRKRTDYQARQRQQQRGGSEASYRTAVTRVVKGIDELLAGSSDSDAGESKAEARTVASGRSRHSVKTRKRKTAAGAERAWLEEEPGSVLDLNDTSAAAKIHRTKPAPAGGKAAGSGQFKLAPDGRMIIDELDDEDKEDVGPVGSKQARRAAKKDSASVGSDDYEDVSDAGADSDAGDSKSKASKQPRYKPGGRGIHRPLVSAGKQAQSGKSKAKNKQAASSVAPYSYVSLDRRLLGKRNQVSQKQQLSKYRELVRKKSR